MAAIHLFPLFDLPFFALATACYFWLSSFHWLIWTMVIALSFIGYLMYLSRLCELISQADADFKRYKYQINSAISAYNLKLYQFLKQRKSYVNLCNTFAILNFDLKHLQASAKKLLKQQQLQNFLSQFTINAAPFALSTKKREALRQIGINHIGELEKINYLNMYTKLDTSTFKDLVNWRQSLIKNFEFRSQPYSLAKLQKQLRNQLQAAIRRYPKQEEKQVLILKRTYQQLVAAYQQTNVRCEWLRKQRNRKAYLLSIATLIK